MKKFKSILKDRNGKVRREFTHDTKEGAEKWCDMQKLYNEHEFKHAGWYTEIEEFDYEFEKPAGFDEYLDRVKAEVERIGRGYSCNFMWRGYNEHHINGYNHFCFSLEGDKVHPLSVGGSIVAYVSDFTRDGFIKELENILIKPKVVYRDIQDETEEKPKKTMNMKTIEEAKQIAQQVINELAAPHLDDMMDDGRDTGDVEQNARFTRAANDVEKIHQQLANLEIEGISSQTLDEEWRKAWGESHNSHLPECKHNHAIRYAKWILSL